MDHFIVEFPNSVPVELCNEIIKRFDNDDRKHAGLVRVDGHEFVNKDMKDSIDLVITDKDDWKDLDNKLSMYVGTVVRTYLKYLHDEFNYNQVMHPLIDISDIETGDRGYVVHKQPYGAEYKWHYDGNIRYFSQEGFLSILIYLNTLNFEEGGSTHFLNGRKVRPEAGKILIFPRNWTVLHCVDKVKAKKGKYVCSSAAIPLD